MRIAIMGIRGLPSTYSGYETFAGELGPRLVERGHEVLIYCRAALYRERPATYRGMQLVYLPSLETKSFSTLSHSWLCVFDLLRRQTDAVLVCNVANGLHLVVPRLFGKKVAINVDGLEWQRPKWNAAGKAYFRFAARAACRLADAVICDAAAMADIYRRQFGVAPVTIAYGANAEPSTRPDVPARYGLEPGRYFLIASRLVPDNNADLIVKAFAGVQTDMQLAIAGEFTYQSAFADRLRATSDPRLRFIGHVDDPADYHEIQHGAYAYIHGHQFGGTNPSLLQALAAGGCVLALDTPFNREVLGDNYGILFSKDSADLRRHMQEIVDRPALREEYARRAPQRIREAYTWERITDQYEALFARLAGQSAPAPDLALR